MTLSYASSEQNSTTPIVRLAQDIWQGNRLLGISIVLMAAGMVLCVALMPFDARLVNGVSTWDKPAKFLLSLGVQFATVSWALARLPPEQRQAKASTFAVWAMVIAAWAELAYIIFRAARGEASHFNDSTLFAQVAFGLMGVGALTLTVSAGLIGWRVWRARGSNLMRMAAGLGLMLGMALGTVAGVVMSVHGSHWVGGSVNDATGIGFFAWSTTGGDLRVAHFIGLHTAQLLPVVAVSGSYRLVTLVAAGASLAVVAAMAWAAAGHPIFLS